MLVYMFIFHGLVPLGKKYSSVQSLDKVCFARCGSDRWQSISRASRGDQYYLTGDDSNESSGIHTCALTLWEFSHVVMHLFVGFFLDLRYSLLIGSAFEIWEWKVHSCENKLDIAYNTLGAIAGGMLRVKLN